MYLHARIDGLQITSCRVAACSGVLRTYVIRNRTIKSGFKKAKVNLNQKKSLREIHKYIVFNKQTILYEICNKADLHNVAS